MKQWMAYCKGCGQLIVWTKMKTGKPMPCDPTVIRFFAGGPECYVTPDGECVSGSPRPDGDRIGYISHFATCPAAKRFRKG